MVFRLIDIRKFLADKGVLLEDGHFVHAQGGHGSAYISKDGIYSDMENVSILSRRLASEFFGIFINPDVVVGPALGRITLSSWTAHHLGAIYKKTIPGVSGEKKGDAFAIRRGYGTLVSGKEVVVVEDILSTGTTVRKIIAAIRALGGNVTGVGAVWNRGGVTACDLAGDGPPLKLVSLVEEKLDEWTAEECPLCARDVPIGRDLGKGKEFLA